METTVTSLLPRVSRSLIAAEIVLSSPGSRTSETPLRISRLVFGSSLLTTVLGSGICLTQTYIFIVYCLIFLSAECSCFPGYPIVPAYKRGCQRCQLTRALGKISLWIVSDGYVQAPY